MHKILSLFCGLLLLGLIAATASAETYQLANGDSLTATYVSSNEKGVTLRLEDGTYTSPPMTWDKFSQDELKKFRSNPKMAVFVDSYIEPTEDVVAKKAELKIQSVPRLERPVKKSLIAAMFSSGVGLMVILLLYAANIYAAYEIAIFRSREIPLVCGVSAILPFIGPIIFLSMPNKQWPEAPTVTEEVAASQVQRFSVPGEEQPVEETHASGGLHIAQPGHAGSGGVPEPQIFARGQFMFNRRFFETKFPGFFGMVRRAEDRDMVLFFKTARGQYTGQRIARIAASELHLQVLHGPASEEVMIPFTEIQEVQLKHKDG